MGFVARSADNDHPQSRPVSLREHKGSRQMCTLKSDATSGRRALFPPLYDFDNDGTFQGVRFSLPFGGIYAGSSAIPPLLLELRNGVGMTRRDLSQLDFPPHFFPQRSHGISSPRVSP